MDIDHQVRIAAFKWLEEQVRIHGDVLPRSLLAHGFSLDRKSTRLNSSHYS